MNPGSMQVYKSGRCCVVVAAYGPGVFPLLSSYQSTVELGSELLGSGSFCVIQQWEPLT